MAADYYAIHRWFDGSKEFHGDFRHRFLRHHLEGVEMAITLFGGEDGTITNSDGRKVTVRWIGEQHLREDFNNYMPRVTDWAEAIQPARWMNVPQKLSRELERQQLEAEQGKNVDPVLPIGRPDQFEPVGTPDPAAVERILTRSREV